MTIADIIPNPAKQYKPISYELVASLMYPSANGPTNPPKLPSELIKPILPAAAVDVRNRFGSVQNAGIYDFIPPAAIIKQASVSTKCPCVQGASKNANTPKRMGSEA